jgi:hypothetical protein
MTRRAMERLISRVKSLKNKLAISWVTSKLLMNPHELIKRARTEVFPFHVLLGTNLRESSPTTSIGSGKTSFCICKEVPKVFRRSKVSNLIVSVYIPHELSEEILYGHLA